MCKKLKNIEITSGSAVPTRYCRDELIQVSGSRFWVFQAVFGNKYDFLDLNPCYQFVAPPESL